MLPNVLAKSKFSKSREILYKHWTFSSVWIVSFRYSSVTKVQEQVLLTLCAGHAPELQEPTSPLLKFQYKHAEDYFLPPFLNIFLVFCIHMCKYVWEHDVGKGGCMHTSWFHSTFKTTMFSEVTKEDQSGITLPCPEEIRVSNPPLTEDNAYIFLHCLCIASGAFGSSEMPKILLCMFTAHPQRPEFGQWSNCTWCCSSQCMLGPCWLPALTTLSVQ